ncbi:WbqC family protein [Enterobacter sp. DRP3]|nr:WbqC family protein [Enterobacter sp. DRP3]
MKIAVMQPYFLPYIGYFQLMSAVDYFVLFDNVQYVRQGWINRNRILQHNQPGIITLPLAKDSRFLAINGRHLSESFIRENLLNQFLDAYRHAPYFHTVFPVVEEIINCSHENLSAYLCNSLMILRQMLSLECEVKLSSDVDIDHKLRSQEKILSICSALGANTYINLPGGRELYDSESFQQQGINLQFIQPENISYPQFGAEFVPWLSIIDVLMFNSKNEVINFCRHRWTMSG